MHRKRRTNGRGDVPPKISNRTRTSGVQSAQEATNRYRLCRHTTVVPARTEDRGRRAPSHTAACRRPRPRSQLVKRRALGLVESASLVIGGWGGRDDRRTCGHVPRHQMISTFDNYNSYVNRPVVVRPSRSHPSNFLTMVADWRRRSGHVRLQSPFDDNLN